ncbi:hypothetical protein [Janibacter limosus]|jgi:hypothetical protein|uniref:hypothetical protein n=1 Tax=Janibacter limosus TaxID=53458 RepID=UPI00083189C9|nr:hypothetical protein [Janibacter limosus]
MIRLFAMMSMMCMLPVRRLDRALEARGQDAEAGLTTLEYVILGALVLAVVVTVAAVITGNLEGWADRIPSAP